MAKIITVTLGDKERTLDVGKARFLKLYGEYIGEDPLNLSSILLKPEMQVRFATAVVYAGLVTDYAANKKNVDFTKDEVEEWVDNAEIETISFIINEYIRLNKREQTEGEAKAQAENV